MRVAQLGTCLHFAQRRLILTTPCYGFSAAVPTQCGFDSVDVHKQINVH